MEDQVGATGMFRFHYAVCDIRFNLFRSWKLDITWNWSRWPIDVGRFTSALTSSENNWASFPRNSNIYIINLVPSCHNWFQLLYYQNPRGWICSIWRMTTFKLYNITLSKNNCLNHLLSYASTRTMHGRMADVHDVYLFVVAVAGSRVCE